MKIGTRFELGDKYWLGEFFETGGWRRATLFRINRNSAGGSTSWPVAEIDVVDHPSRDSCNPHSEIKISIRNEVKRSGSEIDPDGNKTKLRHPDDVLEDADVIQRTLAKLKEESLVTEPLCVYVCMRHVEDFWVEGDFWCDD